MAAIIDPNDPRFNPNAATDPAAPQAAPFNRTQFRDQWQAQGAGANNASLDAYLQPYGFQRDKAGRVALPGGETVDMLKGANAGGQGAAWINPNNPTGAAGVGMPAAGAGGTGAPAAAAAPAADSFQAQIRQMLLEQMKGLSQPVGANDAAISGELQSQERGLERGRQDRRAAMAERFAANGLNSGGAGSGAFESEIASGYEDKGASLSGVKAQLFGRELQARRGQLSNMLQMAIQSQDSEAARSIQMQMAQMDQEIQRLGISTNAGLQNRSLSQQQGQFDDRIGMDMAELEYKRNSDPWAGLF